MADGRTTRDWLASLDDQVMQQLLEYRPDVRLGAPVRDLDDLAMRLEHPASVSNALVNMPQPAVELLEAVTALDVSATRERILALLDGPAEADEHHVKLVEHWLAVLELVGLAWEDGPVIVINPGVHRIVVNPLRLGPPARVLAADLTVEPLKRLYVGLGVTPPPRKAELVAGIAALYADAPRIRRIVGQAPAQVAELLMQHASTAARNSATAVVDDEEYEQPSWTRAGMQRFQERQQMLKWAVEHGVAIAPAYGSAYGYYEATFPSEVLLALAPPSYRSPFHPVPPHLPTEQVAEEQNERSSAAAVTGTVAAVMAVLESMSRSPVTPLKSGGVGARELTRLSKTVGVQVAEVRLALELGAQVRLLDYGRSGIRAGDQFEQWRRRSPEARAADLLTAWWGRTVSATRERDADGKAQPALGGRLAGNVPPMVLVATVLKETDGAVVGVEPVLARLVWMHPLAEFDEEDLRCTWDEAQRLGVVMDGRLTRLGQAVHGGERAEVEAVLRELLPEQSDEVLFGSDLTVVAPGSLGPAVIDLLDTVGTRESHGVGAAWRVGETSVRDALDAGWTVEGLLEDLRAVAGRALPQALEYLLKDVGRRHGVLGVAPAGCVVVSTDEALIAEVAATKVLSRLGLVRVAPTVLAGAADPGATLAALRKAGYLPVETDRSGVRVVELRAGGPLGRPVAGSEVRGRHGDDEDEGGGRHTGASAEVSEEVDAELAQIDAELEAFLAEVRGPGVPAPGFARHRREPEDVTSLVARLRSGRAPEVPGATDELVESIGLWAAHLRADEIAHLAAAVEHGDDVHIRYRSQSGGHSERRVSDLTVGDGYLLGWCHLRQDQRHFRLDRVMGVFPTA